MLQFTPRSCLAGIGLLAASIVCAPAQAALLQARGPSSALAFDTQLSGAALIYDANYFSAGEGRLIVLASGSSLLGPGVSGSNGIAGTAPSQLYLGAGDTLRDRVLELRLNNVTGALVSGTVFIPRDNNSAATGTAGDSWTTSGTVTAFGASDYAASGINTFDLRWGVNSHDFSDVQANPSLVGGTVSCAAGLGGCGMGYLRFSTAGIAFMSSTSNARVNYGVDWVRGAGVTSGGVPNAQLGPFDDGIASSAYLNNAVSADVFITPVPVPQPWILLAAGLAGLVPLTRRRLARNW